MEETQNVKTNGHISCTSIYTFILSSSNHLSKKLSNGQKKRAEKCSPHILQAR